MNRKMNIYYNAVAGGLAGLLCWLVLSLLPGIETFPIWSRSLLKGCIIGLLIGGALGLVEGILDRSSKKAQAGLFVGLVAGAIGGALGLMAGELALSSIEGGLAGRSVGWMLLGLATGIGSGIAYKSRLKIMYGVIGGAIGGLIGGIFLEYFIQLQVAQAKPWMSGVGLVILGLCIGIMIAVVEEVFAKSKLKVVTGMLEGREFNMTKPLTVIGSDERCDIFLPRDRDINHKHCQIIHKGNQYILNVFAESRVQINNSNFPENPAVNTVMLKNNDRIKLGKTLLLFSEAKVKKQ